MDAEGLMERAGKLRAGDPCRGGAAHLRHRRRTTGWNWKWSAGAGMRNPGPSTTRCCGAIRRRRTPGRNSMPICPTVSEHETLANRPDHRSGVSRHRRSPHAGGLRLLQGPESANASGRSGGSGKRPIWPKRPSKANKGKGQSVHGGRRCSQGGDLRPAEEVDAGAGRCISRWIGMQYFEQLTADASHPVREGQQRFWWKTRWTQERSAGLPGVRLRRAARPAVDGLNLNKRVEALPPAPSVASQPATPRRDDADDRTVRAVGAAISSNYLDTGLPLAGSAVHDPRTTQGPARPCRPPASMGAHREGRRQVGDLQVGCRTAVGTGDLDREIARQKAARVPGASAPTPGRGCDGMLRTCAARWGAMVGRLWADCCPRLKPSPPAVPTSTP